MFVVSFHVAKYTSSSHGWYGIGPVIRFVKFLKRCVKVEKVKEIGKSQSI